MKITLSAETAEQLRDSFEAERRGLGGDDSGYIAEEEEELFDAIAALAESNSLAPRGGTMRTFNLPRKIFDRVIEELDWVYQDYYQRGANNE